MTRYTPLWQQNSSYPAATDRGLMSTLWPTSGVTGGAVTNVSNTMNTSVAAGTAAVLLSSGAGTVLCRWDAAEPVTHTAAPTSGNSRIDLVVLQVRDAVLDAGSNNDFIFQAIAGTPATTGSQVAPAVPNNALAVAQVLITGGQANLNSATITPRATALNPRDAYHAKVSRSAIWTIPTGAAVPVPYDTIERDPMGLYSIANQRFTTPIAGIWLIQGAGFGTPPAGSYTMSMNVSQNGTTKGGPNAQTGAALSLSVNIVQILRCNPGDTLQVGMSSYPAAISSTYADPTTTNASLSYLGTG